MERRTFLKAAVIAASTPAVAFSPEFVPQMTAKERAEHHMRELHAALEEATGVPFKSEIAWDVNSAFLFGKSVTKAPVERRSSNGGWTITPHASASGSLT